MRVLVMGGTQFNGLALVRELARHGHDVTVLNRGKTPVELPRGRLLRCGPGGARMPDEGADKAQQGTQRADPAQPRSDGG